MRTGSRKFRRGSSDSQTSTQKRASPLIFDGLELRNHQWKQARQRNDMALVSRDRFLCHAVKFHLLDDRAVFIFSSLEQVVNRMAQNTFSHLIIDINGLSQPLFSLLQEIRRLTQHFPLLRITLLHEKQQPFISRFVALSTPCAIVNRRLPVAQLRRALRTSLPKPLDPRSGFTASEWFMLHGLSSGKPLTCVMQSMNKPYHHGSYLLTRLNAKLGIPNRSQLLRLLHQLSV